MTRISRRREFHDTRLSTRVTGAFHALAIDGQRTAFAPARWHRQPGAGGQELRQAWFTGVHCDIGGGYPGTSRPGITLPWMAGRAREYALTFTPGARAAGGPARMTPAKALASRPGPTR